MKKLILLAMSVLLVTGVTFADGGKKKCCKKTDKACCKKDGKSCCKKHDADAKM